MICPYCWRSAKICLLRPCAARWRAFGRVGRGLGLLAGAGVLAALGAAACQIPPGAVPDSPEEWALVLIFAVLAYCVLRFCWIQVRLWRGWY